MSNNLFVKRGMPDMVSIFPWPLVEVIRAKENLWTLPLRETLDETIISITSRRGAPTSRATACFLDCLRETIDEGARSQDPEQRRLIHSIELLLSQQPHFCMRHRRVVNRETRRPAF